MTRQGFDSLPQNFDYPPAMSAHNSGHGGGGGGNNFHSSASSLGRSGASNGGKDETVSNEFPFFAYFLYESTNMASL